MFLAIVFYLFFFFNIQDSGAVQNNTIKVLQIETGNVIAEADNSEQFDDLAKDAIKTIEKVTVEANPVPKQGYLIKVPLTKSIRVKNKWFDEFINEVILVYNPVDKNRGKIILYTDENTPVFFDIGYNFSKLLRKLNISS